MIVPKCDGFIEFAASGCCCPPGERRQEGQHTNSATQWLRVWFNRLPKSTPESRRWRNCAGHNFKKLRELAEAVETCAEFEELVTLGGL